MGARRGDYGMGHICFWDRPNLPWDGICTHCALREGIRGQFHMSDEELEAYAKEAEEKRLILRRKNNSNWHYKKMAEDYADYIEAAIERKMRSRANNPQLDKVANAKRAAKDLAEKRYHCDLCDISFTSQHSLNDHLQSAKHHRKSQEHLNPYVCKPCNLGYANKSNFTRHTRTKRHSDAVKAYKAKIKADLEAVQAFNDQDEDKENAFLPLKPSNQGREAAIKVFDINYAAVNVEVKQAAQNVFGVNDTAMKVFEANDAAVKVEVNDAAVNVEQAAVDVVEVKQPAAKVVKVKHTALKVGKVKAKAKESPKPRQTLITGFFRQH
ncbi:hypothetical protein VTI74DRAFT_10991 [Chaetomium olivicolor]